MTEEISANKDETATAIELQLGKRISKLRSAKGFTQDKLALSTGFTKGYLSKIENSKVIPPIGTLVKIAQILDTDVADLLEPETSTESDEICVVRSWQRESVIKGATSFGYDYTALAHKRHHKQMEPFIMVFPSEVDRDVRFEHEGEEFMFILSGEVEFEAIVDGRNKTWILSPGDSVYFDSRTPHRGRSLTGESRALVVIYRSTSLAIP
ncbi:MAG: XRE family transcriptional regulator [Herminiimonas sp.]|jgi:transcriptional regulator with XRE-family HTH domain|uniref:helix-turn-helix domain-containing protein n=1 Tax=Herminiimonas sp. TaxID=1926289 RepID=UPI0027292668|nr:XRE family transcriptional regulator [Herminiimonas sp.]MDO9419899.1 XRE family transcriptional regulator [Herminiimonas sp.]